MACGSLLLLAGPNGAGKSTLFRALRSEQDLQHYIALNADDRTLEKLVAAGFSGFADTPVDLLKQFFVTAATEIYTEAIMLLQEGKNVCLETVLSTDKYCEMVSMVTKAGGRFELFYVALRSPEISRERVSLRVQKGGHDVPADRLKERWRRSLEFLPWFVGRADEVIIYDNSDEAPVMLAKGGGGVFSWCVPRSAIFSELLAALQLQFAIPQEF